MARRSLLKLESLNERIAPAAGQLDPFFGTGGLVTTPIGPGDDKGQAVVIDTAGRIVVAGFSSNGIDADVSLLRYDSDGSFDTSFGIGGKVTTAIGAGDDYGLTVVIDNSDRILVAGFSFNGSNMDFALARYDANGNLDPSFGAGGIVTSMLGISDDFAYGLAIDSLGRIVVSGIGQGGTKDVLLFRYISDGTLDTTFDSDGIVVTDIRGTDDYVTSVAVDSSDRIIITGSSFNGVDHDVIVVRYNPDGSLDSSFNGGGIVITPMGPRDEGGTCILVDDVGRIVIGGRSENGSDFDLMVARYLENGSLDPTFDSDGKIGVATGPGEDYGDRLAIDELGRILLAGSTSNGTNFDNVVIRVNPDGSLDNSFDFDGRAITPIGPGGDFGLGIAIDESGRIVVSGTSFNGSNYDVSVVRYLTTFTFTGDPNTLTYTEDAIPLTIDSTIALTNSPNANLAGATVQIGSHVRDEDELVYTLQGGITDSFDSLTGLLTLSGSASIADYEAVLRSLTYVNTSDGPNELSRTITITVDDGEATNNLASASYTIHVVALNDAPAFTADGVLFSILQANTTSLGQKVAGLFAGHFADPDTGSSLRGIAVVGNDADAGTEGSWQFSTDNGTTWSDVGIVADNATALALSAGTRIRFVPVLSFTGEPTPLAVRAIDNSFGGFFSSGVFRVTVDTSSNGGIESIAGAVTPIRTTVFPIGTGGNNAPILSGVPVSDNVNEGGTLAFTATAFDPDLAPTLTFSLDSAPPAASIDPDTGVFSWNTTEADGPDTFIFNVQVSDGLATTTKTITVIVKELNVAPVLANVPPTVDTVRGETVEFGATATDADVLNGSGNALTFSLIGGPAGAVIDPTTGEFSWTPDEMTAIGTYNFQVHVVDDGVPAKSHSLPIAITVDGVGLRPSGGSTDLVISGSAGKDTITVNASKDLSQIIVKLGKTTLGTFAAADVTGRIVVRGLGGNDKITVHTKVTKPVDLYGGFGNDMLTGGSGDDRLFGEADNDTLKGGKGKNLLVGGDGNDKLTGGTDRDVLIGGAGSDKLAGGGSTGEDLLIGGSTNFDTDLTGLSNLFNDWNSVATYAERIDTITPGGVLNGASQLSALTVQDTEKDTLAGAGGLDWFVMSSLDKFDLKTGETTPLTV